MVAEFVSDAVVARTVALVAAVTALAAAVFIVGGSVSGWW